MNELSESTKYILNLSILKGVGRVALRKLVQLPGFAERNTEQLADQMPSLKRALAVPGAWEKAGEETETQVEMARKIGATIISSRDAGYPPLLSMSKDDPFLLFVKGNFSNTPTNSVAIIGTRKPTSHGEVITQRTTLFFVEQGWSVVSGLALGCDAIAHQAALNSGGHTVAVLAHGLQTIAPSQNRQLAEDILDAGGALVSQYRFGREAIPAQFVERDQTQAGMAQGVVMIQSDLTGGSLHASRASLGYERWLAVPYPTDADRSRSDEKIQSNLLLSDGTPEDKMKLLACSENQLQRLIILRSKQDYPNLLTAFRTETYYEPHPPIRGD